MTVKAAIVSLGTALSLAGCALAGAVAPVIVPGGSDATVTSAPDPVRDPEVRLAARTFVQVVDQVEPVAEATCREMMPRANCDFRIVVDDRPGVPPNAFQTLDSDGNPIIAFTLALILDIRNPDELAFVMAHEAAHHILRHLDKVRESAVLGATILSGVAAMTGASAEGVRSAEQLGAAVGARVRQREAPG